MSSMGFFYVVTIKSNVGNKKRCFSKEHEAIKCFKKEVLLHGGKFVVLSYEEIFLNCE